MARGRGRIGLSITADNKNLKRTVKDSEGDLGRLQRVGVSSTRGLSAGFKAASGVIAGAAIADQIHQTITAAQDAEASQAKVQKMVENVGLSWTKYGKRIDEVIQKQSRLTGLDDEELAESFANMLRSTKDVSQALKLNGLAADLARTKGMDLAGAQSLIARVYNGSFLGLKRLGIAFEPVTTAQDKLKESTKTASAEQIKAAKHADAVATRQKAIAALQKQFGGQAAAYGRTSAGASDRFRVAIENLRESVGTKLLPVITRLTNKAANFVNEMQDGTGAGGRFAHQLGSIADKAAPILAFFKDHPKLIAVAVGAWATYRAAAAVATAATRLKLLGQFTGLGRRAAVGGAEAGAAFGTAATTAAGGRLSGKGGKGGIPGRLGGLKGQMSASGVLLGRALGAAMVLQIGVELGTPLAEKLGRSMRSALAKIAQGDSPLAKAVRLLGIDSVNNPSLGDLGVEIPSSVPKNRQPIEGDPAEGKPGLTKTPPRPRTPTRPKRTAPTRTPLGQNAPRAHTSVSAMASRGPAQVAGATTEKRRRALALMEQAWRAAAPHFGRSGKRMPRVRFTGDSSPIVGMARNPGAKTSDTGVIYWPDWMTDWLLGLGNPGDRDAAFATLIHEWAHYFQREGLSDTESEGGAQAFARRIAPKVAGELGLSYRNLPFGSDQYPRQVSQVKRTRGERFITSGQFRGGAKATTARAASTRRVASTRTSSRATAHTAAAAGAGIVALGRQLQSEGYTVGENPAFGGVAPVHVPNSYHYRGLAIDVNGGPGGEPASLDALYQRLRGKPGVVELLWRVAGHFDHLHVAVSGSRNPLTGEVASSTLGEGAPGATSTARPAVPRPTTFTATLGKKTVASVPSPTALGRKTPKTTGPSRFISALRPADPGVQAKNMRLFEIGNRINYINAAIQGGRVKTPATLQRLAGELEELGTESEGLLNPEKPTGLDAIPGASAYINRLGRDSALAALTPDTADDTKVARDTVTAWQSILDFGQTHGASDTDIADFATNLKGAQDALKDLTDAVNQNTQQLLDLEKQRSEELARERNVSQAQYDRILDGIGAIANGRIGGRLGLGFATPSYAGGVARP